jgi:hypothetical protein
MRNLAIAVALVLTLLALLWYFFASSDAGYSASIPADSLGVVIVNEFPDSLQFLENSNVSEWLEIDAGQVRDRLAVSEPFLSYFQKNVRRMWICLHQLEQKDRGTFRIHFSAFVNVRRSQSKSFEQWLAESVTKAFGEGKTEIIRRQMVTTFRGEEPGHLLYHSVRPDCHVLSNSEEGWRALQQVEAGAKMGLSDLSGFQAVAAEIGLQRDVVVYFRGAGVRWLLPEFGYGLDFEGNQVSDDYFEVERSR